METNNFPGFWFNPVQPMRQPEVKRYTVNKSESKWDLNELKERQTKSICGTDLDQYRIVSYQSGNALIKGTHLTWKHFDWVQKLTETKHPIKNEWATTFIAYRNEQLAILITERI